MSLGGDSALHENASRLKELEGRAQKTEEEKEAVSSEIDKLKEDIAKQQVVNPLSTKNDQHQFSPNDVNLR